MEAQPTTERVEQVVFDGLVEVDAPREELSREATFEQLDVDSLDLVELARIVEDEFGIEMHANDMKQLSSVGDVIDFVIART